MLPPSGRDYPEPRCPHRERQHIHGGRMRACVLEGFARQRIRVAVLSVLVLGMAGVSLGQTAGSAAQPTTKTALAVTPPEKASLAAQAGQPAAPGKRQPGGNHEGIK